MACSILHELERHEFVLHVVWLRRMKNMEIAVTIVCFSYKAKENFHEFGSNGKIRM
jgi:hypothetical protein